MKKVLICAFTAVLSIFAFAGGYKITVAMPDVSLNNATAYLTNYDTGDTVATSVVHGKRCVIKGKIEDSFFARLVIDGKRCGMVVEDGEIAVDWSTKTAYGSPLNDYANKLDKALDGASSDEEITAMLYKAFEENKNNAIGSWAFYNYLMMKPLTWNQLQDELKKVPSSYLEMKRVKQAEACIKAQSLTAEGQMFTDFTVTKEDGTSVKLSDYVGKGTYTLVDFWASWCGPCRREIPNIKAMYEKYNGKGMSFLGVAVWDAPADTHRAISQLDIPWPVIVGNQKLTEPTKLYGIMGIPHIIIFDPEGRIISRGLQGKKLIEAVEACMAK